jgi:hypothetical protein
VVAVRRQRGNPLGWLFLVVAICLFLGTDGGDYAVFSYRMGHHLSLGPVALALDHIWGPQPGAVRRRDLAIPRRQAALAVLARFVAGLRCGRISSTGWSVDGSAVVAGALIAPGLLAHVPAGRPIRRQAPGTVRPESL